MNRFWFALQEGFSGLGRAKLAGTATVAAMSIALMLIGSFVFLMLQARFFLEGIQEKVDIEILLKDTIEQDEVEELGKAISEQSWVSDVTYVSKEKAAERFKQEFGEDVISVTGYNPLPPSFTVRVKWENLENTPLDSIIQRIQKLPVVTEVIYRDKLLAKIREYRKIILQGSFIIGTIVCLGAIFLVANTIRLSIFSKREIITLMELVGANRIFIHLPFLFEGAVQGFLGGLLGAGFLWLLLKAGAYFLPLTMVFNYYLIAGVIVTGIILGIIGSLLGLRRFLT